MPPVGREEFRDALEELDPEGLARFVADLHRARGATVERSGTRVAVTSGERTREFVIPRPDARADAGAAAARDADAAVTTHGDGRDGPAVPDATALHRRLLYGFDRETCSTLVERHLGRPLESFDGGDGRPRPTATGGRSRSADPAGSPRATTAGGAPRGTRRTADRTGAGSSETAREQGRDTDGTDTRGPPPGAGDADRRGAEGAGTSEAVPPSPGPRLARRRAAVAVLFLLVSAAALAGVVAVGVPTADDGGATGAGSRGVLLEPVDPSEVDAPAAAERADMVDGTLENGLEPANPTGRPVGRDRDLPPAIDESGAIDERAVAERTVAHLENRSYRLTFVVRESVDGRPTAVRREVVRVENETTYAVSITRAGRFVTGPPTLADEEVYANGTARFVREPNGTVRPAALRPGSGVPYAAPLDRYLRWYLSVSESTVVDATTGSDVGMVWLRLDGDPYPGVVDTSGSVLVDRRGVVRELHRSYGLPDRPAVAVVVTLRIGERRGTGLPPPSWIRNASATRPGGAPGW